jgi:intein/homing endonuclease
MDEERKEITEEDIKKDTFEEKQKSWESQLTLNPELFDMQKMNSIDLSKAYYEIDALQNELLSFYLKKDMRFRMAYRKNFTGKFFQFLYDKARLREPVHLSVMGVTRTFTEKNMIFTEKGWRKPSNMDDCKQVLSYNFDLEKYEWKNFELVKRKFDRKEKFYKITFSDKREIELGENHPIFTERKGWKRAFSLYKGIGIPFYSDYLPIQQKDKISIERARIIAFMLSCGHLNGSSCRCLDKRDGKYYTKKNYAISYCSSSQKMVNLFRKDMKKEFGLEMKYKKKRYNTYKGIEVERSHKKIFEELSKYIPIGKKSYIIRIPDEIFNSSKEIQSEFIATLFSGDGYISGKESAVAEYYSCSKEIGQQLQLILMQYGIISYINKKKMKSGNFIFRLTITNKHNILNFKKFIKRLPNLKKNKRLNEICKKLRDTNKFLKPYKFEIINKEEIKLSEGQEIFDIFVEDNHNFFMNGILTKNSGKSYSGGITTASFLNALYGRKTTIDYICANSYEFLEKIQQLPSEMLTNSCFLIDEDKMSVYNTGSIAKKMKLSDVQNIIAMENISTISINPQKFANSDAQYGLRSFGKCKNTKTVRFMLYNLQEGSRGGILPLGMVYIPIFTEVLPYWRELEEDYLIKKKTWIRKEQRGEGDILADLQMRTAQKFMQDDKFVLLKKKNEKLTYISIKLGSEWTKGECLSILNITELIRQGVMERGDEKKDLNEGVLENETEKTGD